tara:strand:- start:1650 stop:2867 length:1218 start_codon:yes stop_codon:yes gene_type:complete
MFIECFKKYPIFLNVFEEDENKRKIDIYKFKDVLLTGRNNYYPNILLKKDNKYIIPILERTMSLPKSELNYFDVSFIEKENKEYIEEKNPLFFFIYNTENYYHFLYDTLPYLISFFKLKKQIDNLKLLMQYPNKNKKNHYKFVIEFLELLNIFEKDIVIFDENKKYNNIYISTSYTHDENSNLPPRKEIFEFYKNISKIVFDKYEKIDTPEKIYISRRTEIHKNYSNIGTNYTTRRKMINEDKLVEKLEKEGYVEVFTENLSTIEKIRYFYQAKFITGAIGGGIANVVFCEKKTKLHAIVSPDFLTINKRFMFCLNVVEVNYDFNTKHVETSEFKKYMRVKIKNSNMIGEIIEYNDIFLKIQITKGENVGWNLENDYEILSIKKNEVERLDNGLNSCFYFSFKNL